MEHEYPQEPQIHRSPVEIMHDFCARPDTSLPEGLGFVAFLTTVVVSAKLITVKQKFFPPAHQE